MGVIDKIRDVLVDEQPYSYECLRCHDTFETTAWRDEATCPNCGGDDLRSAPPQSAGDPADRGRL